MKVVIIFTFLIPLIQTNTFSLEIDKKLLFSIINFSKSKRTLLINKGSENGLKKGDQAKFFLKPENLVARATLIKASPTRSLWSVFKYRNKNIVSQVKSPWYRIREPIALGRSGAPTAPQ